MSFHPSQSRYIGLHKNEYFFDHSDKVLEAIQKTSLYETNLYQCSGSFWDFAAKLAQTLGLGQNSICLTHGAEDALWKLLAFLRTQSFQLLLPYGSWEFYDALGLHLKYHIQKFEMPCTPSLLAESHPSLRTLEETLQAHEGPAVVILASPNNPTGLTLPLENLENWCVRFPQHHFLLDYVYGDPKQIGDFPLFLPNLTVISSFSKFFGLPGIRLGFMVGTQVSQFGFGLGISPQSAICAQAALEDYNCYLKNRLEMLKFAHELALLPLKSLKVWPTQGSFFLTQVLVPIPESKLPSLLLKAKETSYVYPKVLHLYNKLSFRFALGPESICDAIETYLMVVEGQLKDWES